MREKAHKDRVTAIVWHKNFLYSVSYDGTVKMWDATNLELVMEVKKAHKGQRIQCASIGPDGFLYTGGDDKVRPFSTASSLPNPACRVLSTPVLCGLCNRLISTTFNLG